MGLLNRGKSASSTLRKPLPVINVPQASTIVPITAEAVTLSAGATGTTGTFILAYAPIANALGSTVGRFGDSSLAVTSTAFTTEVPFEVVADRYGRANPNQPMNIDDPSTNYSAYLNNGEFYMIYETGQGYYKRADNSTNPTFDYKIRVAVFESMP